MNKLPDSITILGVEWRVEVVPGLADEETGEQIYGETEGNSMHRIRINGDQDSRRQWDTLYHECIHAYLHVTGLGNKLSDETEEVIAQAGEYMHAQFHAQCGQGYSKSRGGK